MRGNQMTETVSDLGVGDQGETLVAMNLRSEVELKSEVVGSLAEAVFFTVVETGAPHRALISCGNASGWISTKTDLDQPLVKRTKEGRGVLPVYEAVVLQVMREEMDFKSEEMATLPAGTPFDLIEEGPTHRVKILCDGMIGWVTARTDLDQPLIKSLQGGDGPAKMTKNLDTLIIKSVSQAQVGKVMSNKGRGGLGMVNSKSQDSSEGQSRAAAGGDAKKKEAPKLSKLACCCG